MYVRERIVNTRSSEKSLLKCRMTKKHFNSKGMQNLQLVQVFSEVIVSESFDLTGFNLSFVQKNGNHLDPITSFIFFKIRLNIKIGILKKMNELVGSRWFSFFGQIID